MGPARFGTMANAKSKNIWRRGYSVFYRRDKVAKARKDSAKKKIRAFLIANVGKIVTTQQISSEAGIIAHARRVRELRDDEGMQIRTHKDREGLKPGQYLLESLESKPVTGGV